MVKTKDIKETLKKEKKDSAPKKSGTIIPANEADSFQLMERRDEEQIVAALEGKYLDEFVYSFPQGGKMVEGLSWVGIQEASRAYGGIQCPIEKVKIDETDKEIVVMLEAIDTQTNSSAIGVSSQTKVMSTRSGPIVDTFARQKAVAKAQRNAKRQLLPQTLLKQWIEKHRAAKSNGKNGSTKELVDKFHDTWRKKGLVQPYVIQMMGERYGVSSTAQLNREQLAEFTKWIEDHKTVEEIQGGKNNNVEI